MDDTPVLPSVFDAVSPELLEKARLKFRVTVDPGVPIETMATHLKEVYRTLNDYLVEQHGTYLPAVEFRRLVMEEAKGGTPA